jgi:RNA polymerase sigma factor (sigma-70 family)
MDPESLLARARAGDQQAWNDLLVWYRPFVRAQLKQALPDWPDEASELTNDAQMKMHRGFPAFRGVALSQFVAWAGRITYYVRVDFLIRLRSEGRAKTVPIPLEPLCPHTEVGARLIEAEDLVQLVRALEKLPEHYRKVIEARLFDRLPPHVIAERLGWPQVRVRVYTHRAVELLARQLRGKS